MSVDESVLIDLVKGYPHLWDKRSEHFKDNIAIENSWKTISGIMEISVEDCQSLWTSIRTRYIKERRFVKNLRTGSASYVIKWPFYEQCGFLDPTITPRRTKGNILKKIEKIEKPKENHWRTMIINPTTNTLEDDNNQEYNDAENGNVSGEDNILNENGNAGNKESETIMDLEINNETPSSSVTLSSSYTQLKTERYQSQLAKKRKAAEPVSKLIETCSDIGKNLNTFLKETGNEETGDYHFAMSLVEPLEKITDGKKKLIIRAKLLNVLANIDEN